MPVRRIGRGVSNPDAIGILELLLAPVGEVGFAFERLRVIDIEGEALDNTVTV